MTVSAARLESSGYVLRAILLRECRAALVNRYFQVFSALALAGGIGVVAASESAEAAALLVFQLALYFVSLFATLAGVSSARGEDEEWPLLFSQPVRRGMFVGGKFVTLWAIFSTALALLFLPAFLYGAEPHALLALFPQTSALAAVFAALGLFAGFLARDRVRGLVAGVCLWLTLIFGVDLVALIGAHWAPLQKAPDIWTALLMLNPPDAFRIQALFSAEQIPPEAAGKTLLAQWWLSHAAAWFIVLALAWTTALVALTAWRLSRREL